MELIRKHRLLLQPFPANWTLALTHPPMLQREKIAGVDLRRRLNPSQQKRGDAFTKRP